jgi:S1-C subfamily serine protease
LLVVSAWLRAIFAAAALFASSTAHALSLPELDALASGSVAHLSVRDAKGDEHSSGSGFVISSSGRLVTNYHVIDGAERIIAVFPDKREALVTGVWAYDQEVDIAILQLAAGSYKPLRLATEPAREAEDIVVIGSPLGLGNSISAGVVSAVREKGLQGSKHFAEVKELANWGLQFTAAAAPGSSGSPILRGNGEVVGVVVGQLNDFQQAHFGIVVAKVQTILGSAPKEPRELTSATGARSVKTNLLISGAFFAGLLAMGLLGSQVQRWRGRPKPLKH